MVKTEDKFGSWLKQERREAGLSQEQLAREIGKKQSWVSDIERGLPHNLTRKEVRHIAEVLKTSEEAALSAAGYYPTASGSDPQTELLLSLWPRVPTETRQAILTIMEGAARN
jgi:transcriptional regulator with XRE-family HTH domain